MIEFSHICCYIAVSAVVTRVTVIAVHHRCCSVNRSHYFFHLFLSKSTQIGSQCACVAVPGCNQYGIQSERFVSVLLFSSGQAELMLIQDNIAAVHACLSKMDKSPGDYFFMFARTVIVCGVLALCVYETQCYDSCVMIL